jgi:hypothetical protein
MSDADAFAQEWLAAFNAHDLDRILSHYAEDVRLISPIYLEFSGRVSDELTGLPALKHYFSTALERIQTSVSLCSKWRRDHAGRAFGTTPTWATASRWRRSSLMRAARRLVSSATT